MKHLLVAMLFGLVFVASAKAQDTRYVGTWKWHYDSPYEDGQNGVAPYDEYIRIDIEDGVVYVRKKLVWKNNDEGYHREGENVMINTDGSISFDVYSKKREYDSEDRLYWTAWTHYTILYKGGRLISHENPKLEAYDKNGRLVEKSKMNEPIHKIYYNEKDNW